MTATTATTTAPTTPTDPALQLLCEHCGYILEGTPTDSNCPECGTPVKHSLPSNRTGSAFQHAKTTRNLLKTAAATLTQPRTTFRNCRINQREGRYLEQVYILVGSVIFAFSPLFGLSTLTKDYKQYFILYLILAVHFAIAGWGLLTLLTWIERRGIRIWGKVHRRRITPAVAATICGHAAVGWAIAGLIMSLGMIVTYIEYDPDSFDLPLGLWLIPIGAITGLLTFEILTYIGLKQCRFANHPTPSPNPIQVPEKTHPSSGEPRPSGSGPAPPTGL